MLAADVDTEECCFEAIHNQLGIETGGSDEADFTDDNADSADSPLQAVTAAGSALYQSVRWFVQTAAGIDKIGRAVRVPHQLSGRGFREHPKIDYDSECVDQQVAEDCQAGEEDFEGRHPSEAENGRHDFEEVLHPDVRHVRLLSDVEGPGSFVFGEWVGMLLHFPTQKVQGDGTVQWEFQNSLQRRWDDFHG